MMGTIDLSRAQFDTIAKSVQAEPHVSGLTVTRVVIHPITSGPLGAEKAVEVVEHILGYGTVRYKVTRSGKWLP